MIRNLITSQRCQSESMVRSIAQRIVGRTGPQYSLHELEATLERALARRRLEAAVLEAAHRISPLAGGLGVAVLLALDVLALRAWPAAVLLMAGVMFAVLAMQALLQALERASRQRYATQMLEHTLSVEALRSAGEGATPEAIEERLRQCLPQESDQDHRQLAA